MNRFFLFLVSFSYLFLVPISILAQEECGFCVNLADIEYMDDTEDDRDAIDMTLYANDIQYIPIQPHIVRASDGTGGLSLADFHNELNVVNQHYSNANMQFYVCGDLNYIDDDYYYNNTIMVGNAPANALYDNFFVPNTINIFYFPNSNYCGWAYFSPGDKGIYMKNSCATNGSTLSHELGHYFSLYHTHQGYNNSNKELVIRNYDGVKANPNPNCAVTGDTFCDTPADPKLSSAVVSVGCSYTGTAVDNNGDTYAPLVDNIMSYSRKHCRTNFTPEQYTRIFQSYLYDRNYLSCDQSCNLAYAPIPYNIDFETGTLDQYWCSISSSGNGQIQVTNNHTPYSGNYHLVLDVNASGANTNSALLGLDLDNRCSVSLDFWWKQLNDSPDANDGIYFSDDSGISYEKVYDLIGGSGTWQNITLDVANLAASNGLSLTSNFIVKFQQEGNVPAPSNGFAFDNISVTGSSNFPVAYFTHTSANSVANFMTASVGTNYTWDFGDGNISTTQSPMHPYAGPGSYNVCLTVNNSCGNDTYCETVEITNNLCTGGNTTVDWTVFTSSNSELPYDYNRGLAQNSNGDVFIGSQNVVAKFDGTNPTGWTLFTPDNSDMISSQIQVIMASSTDDIYFSSLNWGLTKFDGISPTGWLNFNSGNSDIPHGLVEVMIESASNEIYLGITSVASTGGGVARFDGSSYTGWTIYNTDNSDLPVNYVKTMLETSAGDFYVGTSAGLAKFDGTNHYGWTIYDTSNSDLPHNNVEWLLEGANGEIYVGLYSGGLARFDGMSHYGWTLYNYSTSDIPSGSNSADPPGSNGYVNKMVNLPNDDIMLGYFWAGLSTFDGLSPTGWTRYHESNSPLPDNIVRTLLAGNTGEVYVATDGGVAKMDFSTQALVANFSTPSAICGNEAVTFTNTSVAGVSYEWKVEGVVLATTADFNYTFTQAGIYSVSLTAMDANGCEDTYMEIVTIYPHADDLVINSDYTMTCGSDVELSVGDGWNTIIWDYQGNLFGNTATVTATQSGTYNVSILDQCGSANSSFIDVIVDNNCVWPGDANVNGLVSFMDLLYIGQGFGATGPARLDMSINWLAKPCTNWANDFNNGINYKHADTDGNGMIGFSDAYAIFANYGEIHNNTIPDYAPDPNNIDAILGLDNITQPEALNNYTTEFDIVINSVAANFTSTGTQYGIVFTLNYSELSNNVAIDFSTSCLGTEGVDFIAMYKKQPHLGKIAVGITRITHTDILCDNASLARITAILTDEKINSADNQIPASLTEVTMVDANGNFSFATGETGYINTPCLEYAILYGPVFENRTTMVDQYITSSSLIAHSTAVTYDAVNSILLDKGFEVKTGAEFTAKIGAGCSLNTLQKGVIESVKE